MQDAVGAMTIKAHGMQGVAALPRKSTPNGDWLRALEFTSRIGNDPRRTFPYVIDELAERFGDAPALISEHDCFSFRELAIRANRYARWALDQGVQPGETVCLMMPNRADYMAVWLGFSKVGVVVALLNTNLIGAALAHCISIVEPLHIIVADDLIDRLATALPHLHTGLSVWTVEPPSRDRAIPFDFKAIEPARFDGSPLAANERRPITLSDRALCIYTSGTTGLPKAANVSHHRVMAWSHWFAGMMDTGPSDRMYNCLPMYHSIGGIVATGSALLGGGSVIIREKFSATRFWDDVTKWDCTLFQYIGELCRYLTKAPAAHNEHNHRLRLCCGNGLRADVWDTFRRRFHIPRILEFYAATEGNFSLYNAEGHPGAIGRVPSFMANRFPAAIVKFDFDNGEPARDESGRCARCGPDEIGEAIGRIASGSEGRSSHFEGYTSKAETERKVLRNVFAEGDAWLRTGDLMRRDAKGFFYFVDRIGDTFRWKGENVSTTEVAAAVASCPGVVEANVYGVAVPGVEGRAGMAALCVDASFDVDRLRSHLTDRLPDYARPLFLRIAHGIEVTETFKQKKHDLVAQGFDPDSISDPLFFDDRISATYVPIDRVVFKEIVGGRRRL